jgi:hypothetical protein
MWPNRSSMHHYQQHEHQEEEQEQQQQQLPRHFPLLAMLGLTGSSTAAVVPPRAVKAGH